MFVDIVDFKSALAVENILTPYKKGRLSEDKKTRLPKEKITPDVCMDVLKSTNYARNIKDMLRCIADLPEVEQAPFKDVVLAVFDKREQPNDILVLGKKLAVAHGFEEALGEVMLQDEDQEYLDSSPLRVWTYRTEDADLRGTFSLRDYDRLLCLSDETIFLGTDPQDSQYSQYSEAPQMPAIIEAPNSRVVILDDCDSAKLRKISLKESGDLYLRHLEPWPQELDVWQCAQVHLDMGDFPAEGWKYQPDALCLQTIGQFYDRNRGASFDGVVDLSAYGGVVLAHGNYGADIKFVFRDGARVKLYDFVYDYESSVHGARMLPEELDVSNCSQVEIEYDDISNLKNLRFREGAKVSLTKVHKLPDNLDFSQCDEVNLEGCDLANQSHLRFKKGAKVCLANVKNLPPDIDLSECDEVDLSEYDLSKLSQVRFKKGAKIRLAKCQNLPNDFDFSEFSEVNLSGCDLVHQPNLRFQSGAKVFLSHAVNIPSCLDFSQCSEVQLQYCDLAGLTRLCFADGAKAVLSGAKNLPKDIDFSNCVYVEARWCDMENQRKMTFAKGAKVDLEAAKNLTGCLDFGAAAEVKLDDSNLEKVMWMGFGDKSKVKLRCLQNLPPHIDFSPCLDVSLFGLNLQNQDALCFRNKSRVHLYRLQNMPKFMDISLCKEVDISEVALNDVKKILARDFEQIKNSQIIMEKDWQGKTTFTTDLYGPVLREVEMKRQSQLQELHQKSEEQRLRALNKMAENTDKAHDDADNANGLGAFFGRLFGRGGRS